jgi:hypothetical protein
MLASSSGSGVSTRGEAITGGVAFDRSAQLGSVSVSSSSAALLLGKGVIERTKRLLLLCGMFGLEAGILLGHLPGCALTDSRLVGAFRLLKRQGVLGRVQAHGLDADGCYQDDDRDSKPCAPVEEER